MKTDLETPDSLDRAAQILREGGLVALPTETVYGLAGNALSETAVQSIYEAKGRPSSNPLIVHVGTRLGSLDALEKAGLISKSRLSLKAQGVLTHLMDAFWPGPLTFVLPAGPELTSKAVTGGRDTIAIRRPAPGVMAQILDLVPFPLAAPSANRSGRVSPTKAYHVLQELSGRIPLILDGGDCLFGTESTIIRVDQDGALELLRPGALAKEDFVGQTWIQEKLRKEGDLLAPGQLKDHYAPGKPLYLYNQEGRFPPCTEKTFGLILWDEKTPGPILDQRTVVETLQLSDQSQGRQASQKLYHTLRQLDEHPKVEALLAFWPENKTSGLWPALKDRLKRASSSPVYTTRGKPLDP
jgi:L-threonylcarbamoyladenylate synthase